MAFVGSYRGTCFINVLFLTIGSFKLCFLETEVKHYYCIERQTEAIVWVRLNRIITSGKVIASGKKMFV